MSAVDELKKLQQQKSEKERSNMEQQKTRENRENAEREQQERDYIAYRQKEISAIQQIKKDFQIEQEVSQMASHVDGRVEKEVKNRDSTGRTPSEVYRIHFMKDGYERVASIEVTGAGVSGGSLSGTSFDIESFRRRLAEAVDRPGDFLPQKWAPPVDTSGGPT